MRSRAIWGVAGVEAREVASASFGPQQLRAKISMNGGIRTRTKQAGPSEIDAYLLWILHLTLWDEGPFNSAFEIANEGNTSYAMYFGELLCKM